MSDFLVAARKTRCDAARPACGNCSRRSLACSYIHTQPSQPRSKGKKAAAAAAKEEAARTVTKSNVARDGESTPSVTSPSRRHSPASGSQHSHHSGQQESTTHEGWTHRGVTHSHRATLAHSHSHSHHGHSHSHAASGSVSTVSPSSPLSVPIRVDDRLIEESAERDRPLTRSRSPVGPPIAVLPGASTGSRGGDESVSPVSPTGSTRGNGVYMNGAGNGNGVKSPEVRSQSRSPSNSVGGDATVVMRGGKRKSPPGSDVDVRGSEERPEKKRKWGEEAERV